MIVSLSKLSFGFKTITCEQNHFLLMSQGNWPLSFHDIGKPTYESWHRQKAFHSQKAFSHLFQEWRQHEETVSLKLVTG
jgi:hypothetical protein